MTFGEKLRDMRERAGLTQEALAANSGLALGTIRNYEQGLRIALFPAAVKIAKALGVTCEVFADCEDITGHNEEPAKVRPKGKAPARKKPRKK
jgi:transcriptional regulator with XRE-family HTH domain